MTYKTSLNKAILNKEIQEFIVNFEGELSKLAFEGSPFEAVSVQELIQQIESRRRIEKKLPTWYGTQNIIYPPRLNLEQTSSEITAKYKASLISGKNIADITGGFGVDAYFFAQKFEEAHHFEINKELSEIAQHNFCVLRSQNITSSGKNGMDAIQNQKFGVIYADPSRRHGIKGKVFFLNDCLPNIPQHIGEILSNCNSFLLKTSPMLDISVGLGELGKVSEIHIVAVENEVKELLWLFNEYSEIPTIRTINISKSGNETFDFEWNTKATSASFSLPKKYLYEPNAALLKSGAFNLISEKLKVDKLHKNTHLYTSDVLSDFPGRRFLIEKRVPYSKSEMRAQKIKKANIATRNFPESVDTLRKKWKLRDGGKVYLFFITNCEDKKEMLVCSKEE